MPLTAEKARAIARIIAAEAARSRELELQKALLAAGATTGDLNELQQAALEMERAGRQSNSMLLTGLFTWPMAYAALRAAEATPPRMEPPLLADRAVASIVKQAVEQACERSRPRC